MSKWKLIKSNELFSHPRLTLIEDEVMLPDGHETKYLKFKDQSNAVCVIARRDDGMILIQREHFYPINEKLWMFPAGVVPLDEDLGAGANRELAEETSYRAKNLDLIGSFMLNARRSLAKMYVFVAVNLEEDTSFEKDMEEEGIEIFWKTEDEVDELVRTGEIIDNNILAAWLVYKSKK